MEIYLNMCTIGNEMKLKIPAGGALWLNTQPCPTTILRMIKPNTSNN
jgi:hypothetical protein